MLRSCRLLTCTIRSSEGCSRLFSAERQIAPHYERFSKQTESVDNMRSRLQYQSKKRGILENDILLGDFADQYLPKMDKPMLQQYDKLINGEHMEWDLFYYISGKKSPPEELENCEAYKSLKLFVDSKKSAPVA